MEEQIHAFLDKNSPVPLYEQLRQALLEAITSGEIPVGARLPTEEALCAQFGISRPVARQAYSSLITEGYVERMRGRGTFVRSPDVLGRFLKTQISFQEEMEIAGLPHRTELLRANWLNYTPELFSRLGLDKGDRCYHLVRMRYVKDRPYVLVENFVPESIFPGIDGYDLAANSLFSTFKSVYHVQVVRSQRVIAAQTANAEFADLFHVRRGSPVLFVENLGLDQHDRPVDLSREYMDGLTQKFQFEVVNSR